MGLRSQVGEGKIALDSSVFIYYIERHEEYHPVVRPLFDLAAEGERSLITSELTLEEVLVLPYRVGNFPLAERYEEFLHRSKGLSLVPIDRTNLKQAAMLRAQYRAKGADAIQLAAALTTQCTTFITNDRKIPAVAGLRVLQLSDLR